MEEESGSEQGARKEGKTGGTSFAFERRRGDKRNGFVYEFWGETHAGCWICRGVCPPLSLGPVFGVPCFSRRRLLVSPPSERGGNDRKGRKKWFWGGC
jgi:hypothetical protein